MTTTDPDVADTLDAIAADAATLATIAEARRADARIRTHADRIVAAHRRAGVLVGDSPRIMRRELGRVPAVLRDAVCRVLADDVREGADR